LTPASSEATIKQLEFILFPKTSLRHFRRNERTNTFAKTPVYDRGGPGSFGHGEAEAICNALDLRGLEIRGASKWASAICGGARSVI
jgi:hypothetical protein